MNDHERPAQASVKRLSIALLGLVGLSMIWITGAILQIAIWPGDPILIFPTTEGPQTLDVPSMPVGDFQALVAMLSISDICWLYGLAHIFGMSLRFLRGDVLTTASVSHFLHFGWALMASAVAELITPCAAGSFLAARGHLSSFNPWPLLLNADALTTGIGATLVILIARILRDAVSLSEEAKLTI